MTTTKMQRVFERVEALPDGRREAWTRAVALAGERGALGAAARRALGDVPPDLRGDLAAFAELRHAAELERERALDRLLRALEGEARRTVRGCGLEGELALARAEARVADRLVEGLSRARRRS